MRRRSSRRPCLGAILTGAALALLLPTSSALTDHEAYDQVLTHLWAGAATEDSVSFAFGVRDEALVQYGEPSVWLLARDEAPPLVKSTSITTSSSTSTTTSTNTLSDETTTTTTTSTVNVDSLNLDDAFQALEVARFSNPNGGTTLYKATAMNLNASTAYVYEVRFDRVTGPDLSQSRGVAYTFPPRGQPTDFAFGATACADTGSNTKAYVELQERLSRHGSPFVFITGDMFYADIDTDDPQRFHDAYNLVFQQTNARRMYRSTNLAYTWDDHDFAHNNGDGSSPSKPAARQVYHQTVPHYPFAANGLGGAPMTSTVNETVVDLPIYQSFAYGRVRFLLTDTRSEKSRVSQADSPTHSVYGDTQKAWLKQELLDASSRGEIIFWISSIPWIVNNDVEDDTWGGYKYERAELANFIANNNVSNVFMISGDAHMSAVDDGSHNNYADTDNSNANFPVFQLGALDNAITMKGGPYSHGCSCHRGQYGVVSVRDNGGSDYCVDVEVHSVTLPSPTIHWSSCDPPDAVSANLQLCETCDPGTRIIRVVVPLGVVGIAAIVVGGFMLFRIVTAKPNGDGE